MKQYIPILLSLAFIGCSAPVTAHKEDIKDVKVTQQVSEKEDKTELSNEEKQYCNSLYEFAEVAMQVRQGGVTLKDALDSQPKPSSTATQAEKEMLPLLQAILYEAYKQPLYHTEQYKKEVINEFSKDVYLACIGD